jgi:fumarate hydratase class II
MTDKMPIGVIGDSKCAALADGELGQPPKGRADPVMRGTQPVIDGRSDGEFPLVTFQTGALSE